MAKEINKSNFHPCKECDYKRTEHLRKGACTCHLLEAWEKENQEYYYYQCQEKDCGIPANGPKPCKIGTTQNDDSHKGFCIYSKVCKGIIWKQITKEQYDNINLIASIKVDGKQKYNNVMAMGNKKMIPTMRVNYFDGSYYTVRKDKPGWEDIIESINKKKGYKFLLETSREDQLRIIKNVDLVKITEVEMTEEDYMKIPASPEIGDMIIIDDPLSTQEILDQCITPGWFKRMFSGVASKKD